MNEHTFQVEPVDEGTRVDVFLTRHLEAAPSRTYVQRLIAEGHVLVDGLAVVKAHHKLADGAVVVVALPAQQPVMDIVAENIPLKIVYEDDHLLVVDKPTGMLVHPVRGQRSGTLVNALLYYCRTAEGRPTLSDISQTDDEEAGEPANFRPGIVHRLDRETSGLILVAKDNRTHVILARLFEKRRVKKRYLAIVKGNVELDEGVIDVPLGKHPRYWDRKAVSFEEGAREARTFYRVLRRWGGISTLVALFPLSGRTHQLRVHMAHIGHPILGDERYGGQEHLARMYLHAQAIGFVHPQTKNFIEFFSAMPPEFRQPPAMR